MPALRLRLKRIQRKIAKGEEEIRNELAGVVLDWRADFLAAGSVIKVLLDQKEKHNPKQYRY